MWHTKALTDAGPVAIAAVFCLVGPARAEPLPELEGLLEPDVTVELASPVPGVIQAIEVDRSDLVSKDQVLARLQDSVQQAQVELARARVGFDGEISAKKAALEFAERKFARTAELYDKKVVALDAKDEAEARARVAQQELRAATEKKELAGYELQLAQKELELRSVRSPIDGVVMERLVSPGSHVDDAPILRIAGVDPLRVEVVVPVNYFGAIAPGMQARVIPEVPVTGPHVATVTRVDKVVDAASGTFSVRLSLPNPGRRLPSGLKCRVIFHSGLTQNTTAASP
ncbi:MAG: efflux RND transporter periplasmic adaptor subunit [Chromatiales bacterium]